MISGIYGHTGQETAIVRVFGIELHVGVFFGVAHVDVDDL